MLYFRMKENINFVNRPIIINWQKRLVVQELYKGCYENVPKRIILEIRPNPETEFVDIVSIPFLIVSKKIQKVLELYEPNMEFKEIILLDKVNGLADEYVLPLFQTKDALSDKSIFSNFHTVLKKMVLKKSKLGDTAAFFVRDAPRDAGIWRMDILEALLVRRAKGFILEEVEIEE